MRAISGEIYETTQDIFLFPKKKIQEGYFFVSILLKRNKKNEHFMSYGDSSTCYQDEKHYILFTKIFLN